MPDSSQPLPLLDALRERSAALRDRNAPAQPSRAGSPRETDRRLLHAFRWLDEVLGHLDVIRPVVAHRFSLGGVLTIATPRYDRGFVSCRRTSIAGFELIERIELYYRMANDEPIRVEMQPGAAVAMEDRLRGAQLDFHYRIEYDEKRRTRRGVFTITPAVMAVIRFVADYQRGIVSAMLRNVDRFEPVTLAFAPSEIAEPALEDLVRLMMGEANSFLKRAPLAGVGAGSQATASNAPTSLSPSRYRAGAT